MAIKLLLSNVSKKNIKENWDKSFFSSIDKTHLIVHEKFSDRFGTSKGFVFFRINATDKNICYAIPSNSQLVVATGDPNEIIYNEKFPDEVVDIYYVDSFDEYKIAASISWDDKFFKAISEHITNYNLPISSNTILETNNELISFDAFEKGTKKIKIKITNPSEMKTVFLRFFEQDEKNVTIIDGKMKLNNMFEIEVNR